MFEETLEALKVKFDKLAKEIHALRRLTHEACNVYEHHENYTALENLLERLEDADFGIKGVSLYSE